MKKKLFFVCIVFLLAGCKATRQQLFYPTKIIAPVFTHNKASISGSVNYSDGNRRDLIGYSVEGHISPINSLGIGALHSGYKNKNSQPYKLNETIIQAGYYSHKNIGVQFQIYGGVAFGSFSANNYFDSSNNFVARVDADYFDFFMQPGVVYNQNNFSISSGFRFGSRKFSNIHLYKNTYDKLSDEGRYTYLQPFIDISLGHKNYKFNTQLLFSSPLNGSTPTGEVDEGIGAIAFSPLFPQYLNFSAGIKVDITKDMFKFK